MISVARHGRPDASVAAATRTAASWLFANLEAGFSICAGAASGREHAAARTKPINLMQAEVLMADARLSFRTMGEVPALLSHVRVRVGIVCNAPAF